MQSEAEADDAAEEAEGSPTLEAAESPASLLGSAGGAAALGRREREERGAPQPAKTETGE